MYVESYIKKFTLSTASSQVFCHRNPLYFSQKLNACRFMHIDDLCILRISTIAPHHREISNVVCGVLAQSEKSSLHILIFTKVYNFSPSSLFRDTYECPGLLAVSGNTRRTATLRSAEHGIPSIPLLGTGVENPSAFSHFRESHLFTLFLSGLKHLFLSCPRSSVIPS